MSIADVPAVGLAAPVETNVASLLAGVGRYGTLHAARLLGRGDDVGFVSSMVLDSGSNRGVHALSIGALSEEAPPLVVGSAHHIDLEEV